jgi:hypothetical protein
MQLFDLSIDRTTGTPTSGAISARGPGWVRHIARDVGAPMGDRRSSQPPAGFSRTALGLTYVYVDFQDSIKGNLNQREITFGEATDRLRAGGQLGRDWMATTWPPSGQKARCWMPSSHDSPDAPLHCEPGLGRLRGERQRAGRRRTVRGRRPPRTSEDKDQLVLEGDGRSPAEISYAQIPLAARTPR